MRDLPPIGSIVRMVGKLKDDPDALRAGDRGTVTDIDPDHGEMEVQWDNGETLLLHDDDPWITAERPD